QPHCRYEPHFHSAEYSSHRDPRLPGVAACGMVATMVDLTGQLAIVTGGARDIGRAICLQLARCGAQVAFCYRESEAAAAETLAALRQTGAAALAVQADVTRPAHIARFLAAAHSAFPA